MREAKDSQGKLIQYNSNGPYDVPSQDTLHGHMGPQSPNSYGRRSNVYLTYVYIIYIYISLFPKITLLQVIPPMAFNSSHLTFYLAYLSCIPSGMTSEILSGISSDVLPGISSDILSVISSDILSSISSDVLSGILSGVPSDILSDISSDILSVIIF